MGTNKPFEDCVSEIVENRGGTHTKVLYEPNGIWARVLFQWEDHERRIDTFFALEAEETQDLLDSGEVEELRSRPRNADDAA